KISDALEHWRHFEHFYIRLRSIENRFYNMWRYAGLVFKRQEEAFLEYIKKERENNGPVVAELYRFKKRISNIRDNIVHFAKLGFIILDGKFQIPNNLETEKDKENYFIWHSYSHISEGGVVETTDKMRTDFQNLFEWLNPLEDTLISLINQALQHHDCDIAVNYDNVEKRDTILTREQRKQLAIKKSSLDVNSHGIQTSGASMYDSLFPLSCQSSCEVSSESGAAPSEQIDERDVSNNEGVDERDTNFAEEDTT
ncbi:MAG: hypothetical protein ABIH04_01065, partial [Planctomycetota bacterium]